jgi:hypothetical protein
MAEPVLAQRRAQLGDRMLRHGERGDVGIPQSAGKRASLGHGEAAHPLLKPEGRPGERREHQRPAVGLEHV